MKRPDLSQLGLVTEGGTGSWAVFSPDRAYRYMLARTWDGYDTTGMLFPEATRPLMVFVMLNPSVADGAENDPTIRRCIGFAKRERCGGILVVNLCAYVSTDPKRLLDVDDPIGPKNVEIVQLALRGPLMAVRVAAWGRVSPKVLERAKEVIVAAKLAGALWCLGKTKDGQPRHPVRLANDTPLVSMVDGRPFP